MTYSRSDLMQVTGPEIFLCSSANYLMETEQKFNFSVWLQLDL